MQPADLIQFAYYVISTLGALGALVAGVWAWGAKQAVKNADIAHAAAEVRPLARRIEDAEKELSLTRERLRAMEQKIAAQPTVDMVHAIQLSLAKLEGQMQVIGGEVKAAASSAASAMEATNRLEEFFIAKGLKA